MRIPVHRHPRSHRQRCGAVLVILAVLMVAFMVVAAFAIDIAGVQLARTELRTATDAAAKAAAVNLSRTSDPVQARQRGAEIASQNEVMGRPLSLAADDFEFGHAAVEKQTGRLVFFPGRSPQNAVRVSGVRAESGLEGALPPWLANMLGRDFLDVRAAATVACLDGGAILTVSQSQAE